MKAAPALTGLSLLALVAALVLIFRQGGEAHALRQEAAALQSASVAPPPPAEPPAAPAPRGEPLSDAERLELVRLRAQVTRLRGEAHGVESARSENTALKERLKTVKANPGSASAVLPPGYILRRSARNAGQATPEATVETFLWALEHRDVATLLRTLAPDDARKLGEMMQKPGEDFWKGASALPGMRVRGRKELPDGSVELQLSVDLEESGEQHTSKARLVDGLWRIEMR